MNRLGVGCPVQGTCSDQHKGALSLIAHAQSISHFAVAGTYFMCTHVLYVSFSVRSTYVVLSFSDDMAYERNRVGSEEGMSVLKFWLLFIVGLVVVLSLFRGFMGGVENATLREAERKKKRRSKRIEGRTTSKPTHQD